MNDICRFVSITCAMLSGLCFIGGVAVLTMR